MTESTKCRSGRDRRLRCRHREVRSRARRSGRRSCVLRKPRCRAQPEQTTPSALGDEGVAFLRATPRTCAPSPRLSSPPWRCAMHARDHDGNIEPSARRRMIRKSDRRTTSTYRDIARRAHAARLTSRGSVNAEVLASFDDSRSRSRGQCGTSTQAGARAGRGTRLGQADPRLGPREGWSCEGA